MNKYRIISISVVVLGVSLGFIMNNQPGNEPQSTATATISTAPSVSVITASKQNVTERFTSIGTVSAINDVAIISETQGRVVKVYAEVGEYKKAGSVLIEVDSELKEAAYKAAKVSYEKAKNDLARFEELYKEKSISDSQMEQARWAFQTSEAQYVVARRQLSDTKITTPISGIVTARNVNIGSFVQGAPQSTLVANVVDISKLKVKLNVAEKDVFRLKSGNKVDVTTDIFPNTVFTGVISTISPKGDEAHTYPVEIVMDNSKQQLKAGMFAHITFNPQASTNALVIPREAVVGSMKNAKIYVVKNNVANLRSITTGKSFGTSVEVLQGLNEGESVVVNGQNNLKDNANVVVRK